MQSTRREAGGQKQNIRFIPGQAGIADEQHAESLNQLLIEQIKHEKANNSEPTGVSQVEACLRRKGAAQTDPEAGVGSADRCAEEARGGVGLEDDAAKALAKGVAERHRQVQRGEGREGQKESRTRDHQRTHPPSADLHHVALRPSESALQTTAVAFTEKGTAQSQWQQAWFYLCH